MGKDRFFWWDFLAVIYEYLGMLQFVFIFYIFLLYYSLFVLLHHFLLSLFALGREICTNVKCQILGGIIHMQKHIYMYSCLGHRRSSGRTKPMTMRMLKVTSGWRILEMNQRSDVQWLVHSDCCVQHPRQNTRGSIDWTDIILLVLPDAAHLPAPILPDPSTRPFSTRSARRRSLWQTLSTLLISLIPFCFISATLFHMIGSNLFPWLFRSVLMCSPLSCLV
jgi:hypothetical protein